MTIRKSRSGALRNEFSIPAMAENATGIIRFSPARRGVHSAERFSVIFSPALIFPLVLSFVSRQRKEHYQGDRHRSFRKATFGDGCSLSFARPKESEPKEKGGLRKWSRSAVGASGSSCPFMREAISMNGGTYMADENPEIASSGIEKETVDAGRDSIFARRYAGVCPMPIRHCLA
jgi:hypothetical protein